VPRASSFRIDGLSATTMTTTAAGTFGNWLGVFLDTPEPDWREIAALLEEAFRGVAPKRLVGKLDES
jgi:hypothetical protein